MPTLPQKVKLSSNGGDIYNALVTDTPALKNAGMPFAATDNFPNGTATARDIGNLLYNNINLSNQFIPALLNNIALRVVQSKYWEDPWVGLEKGRLENGEYIEEIFIMLAKPHQFDQAKAEDEVFKRDIPNVMTAFHGLNYQKFYKQTISPKDLSMAFSSWDSFHSFVEKIITNMFKSANYDINQTKRYMVARACLQGMIYMQEISPITNEQTAKDASAHARTASLNLLELNTDYNYFNVPNDTPVEDQVIIINNAASGTLDVNVLADAFNIDKAEFLAMHRLPISNFGNLDMARLKELYGSDPSFVELTQTELASLNTISFIIFDRNWFQIYDYFNGVTNIFNSDGLYWNYDYHVWKAFGMSPFSNAIGFTVTPASVTSVTVSPSAVTVSAGQSAQLTATVVTTGFAPKDVIWSTNNNNVTVSSAGVVTVGASVAKDTTVTVTATAKGDSSKTGTCTLTVG